MKSFVLQLLSYPLTVIFYILFGFFLLVFDPVQRVCLRLFGYKAHHSSVALFNGIIVRCLHILGTRFVFSVPKNLPKNQAVIIVANHQSMWDIPPIIWFLRKLHPKFISKKELGKGIPTISYNLKYGGSVLIDRNDSEQASREIRKIGRYITTHKRSVVIFPEGSRSRTGVPKPFKRKGLRILFEEAPEALVLPVRIENSWKLQKNGLFPMPLGIPLRFSVLEPIPVAAYEPEKLIDLLEEKITTI